MVNDDLLCPLQSNSRGKCCPELHSTAESAAGRHWRTVWTWCFGGKCDWVICVAYVYLCSLGGKKRLDYWH